MRVTRGWWRRTAAVVALPILLAGAASGVAPTSWGAEATGSGKPLRVGIAPIYPPLAFKQDGTLKGIEPEFARRLGARLDRPVAFHELGWSGLLPALRDGRIDVVMSGMSVTDDRKREARFVEPYLQVGQMALIRAADFERLREPGALDRTGLTIGFLGGTTSEEYAQNALRQPTLRPFTSSANGIAALRNEQIDAWIQDAPAIWRITGGFFSREEHLRGLFTPLTEEHLAWAVRLDDATLADTLDTVVREWKADGTVDDVVDDWITTRRTTLEVKARDVP